VKRTSAFLLLTASLAQITLRLIPISREAIPGISGVWAANMMAQELSAWFVVVNLIGLALSLRWSKVMSVIFSAAALFSIYPFFLVPGVNHEMARQWEETGMNPARVAPPGAVSVFLQSFSSLTDSAAHSEVEAFTNPIVYYLPTRINAAASPIVIDLHGGSWQHGSPKEDEALSQHLAAQGYSVFAVDYRRAPLHRHPAQIEDVRQAIGWIKSNAKRLHADASRIALIGHSAGAHLAMLAAFAEPDTAIRAVVGFYGPADLNALYLHPPSPDPLNVPAKLEALIGLPFATNAQVFRSASPIHYVRTRLPPTLLIQGARDHIVPAQLTRSMHMALRKVGNRSLLLEIPWSEHNFDMVWFGPGNRLARAYVDAFLTETLR
jgi:acetyl esterase/lipase